MAIDLDTVYTQQTVGVLQRSIAGITVLLHDDWERPMSLDPLSHLVWTCLGFGATAREIVEDIEAVVPLEPPAPDAETPELLDLVVDSLTRLLDLGLVRPVNGAGARSSG